MQGARREHTRGEYVTDEPPYAELRGTLDPPEAGPRQQRGSRANMGLPLRAVRF